MARLAFLTLGLFLASAVLTDANLSQTCGFYCRYPAYFRSHLDRLMGPEKHKPYSHACVNGATLQECHAKCLIGGSGGRHNVGGLECLDRCGNCDDIGTSAHCPSCCGQEGGPYDNGWYGGPNGDEYHCVDGQNRVVNCDEACGAYGHCTCCTYRGLRGYGGYDRRGGNFICRNAEGGRVDCSADCGHETWDYCSCCEREGAPGHGWYHGGNFFCYNKYSETVDCHGDCPHVKRNGGRSCGCCSDGDSEFCRIMDLNCHRCSGERPRGPPPNFSMKKK